MKRNHLPNTEMEDNIEAMKQRGGQSLLNEASGYAVIAYRWGWTNNGGCVLKVTPDLESACDKATAYTQYRGGKYGCEVVDSDGEPVFYSPSSYGEKKAHHNERIEAFETLGQAIYCKLEDGEDVTSEFINEKFEAAKKWAEIIS